MRRKKRIGLIMLVVGVLVGVGGLLLSQHVLHKTSETAFCLSCHSMSKPFEEYQGTVHFSNQKGIRAECADCHIPKSGVDYLFAKLKASKDIYHEFVSGKIDSDDKFEAHRQETVWKQLRETDSATCRSCHTFNAMDIASQSESAQKMHTKAQKDGETCIDCHKGIAHFPPEIKMDDNAVHELEVQAATSVTNGAHIYPFKPSRIGELATANPGTDLTVVDASGKQPIVQLQGYQMQGSENTLYVARGQRLAIATLSDAGIKALTVISEWQADEYGNQWRAASLQGELLDPALADRKPLWQYAGKLDDTYCAGCHAPIAADHYTVNAWPSIAKGMGARTSISDNELDILTRYFQYNAKDITEKK
ncbi:NapC/NirT family cytochrome c [Escherichia albertii]|uniref:NapC/NirT family cytochrome c n=1 Tax=Escherichia albertii TaxID=208962 RepID=UPI00137497CF|nr:NapC/NirT family cytochrome c [Escherichia albertii]